jgi:hypothetical protein
MENQNISEVWMTDENSQQGEGTVLYCWYCTVQKGVGGCKLGFYGIGNKSVIFSSKSGGCMCVDL